MKKLVFESLDELLESKLADIKDTHAKVEKTEAKKQKEDKKDKIKRAIESLKDQIKKAKKPGAFNTVIQKNYTIKELEDKIKAWEEKLENIEEK